MGSKLPATVAGGKVTVNDATVAAAVANAGSVVAHVIDKVRLPPLGPVHTGGMVGAAGCVIILAVAAARAGLVNALKGAGQPYPRFTGVAKRRNAKAQYNLGIMSQFGVWVARVCVAASS